MRHNKLVRDNIPEIIKKAGAVPITHIASDEEYWQKLKEKFQEEIDEFIEGNNEDELADILEVVYAICDYKKVDRKTLELLRKKKAEEKGGYQKKIILDETK